MSGDLISREQAIGALQRYYGEFPCAEIMAAHDAILALPSIAPDTIEAEISVADEWVKAYPESIFPPLSDDEIAEAGTKLGDAVMSRLHAGWARHIYEWIRRDLAAAKAVRDGAR